MFGPLMTLRNAKGDLQIRMAAIPPEDAGEFIRDGGIQSIEVTRYLGRIPRSNDLQDELDWLDKVRTTDSWCVWGIYVRGADSTQGDWQLVGTTSINEVPGRLFKTAVTGIIIFRKEYWNRGVASACHKARTMFSIDWRADICIRSMVLDPNEFSARAIEGVGYVYSHCEPNEEIRGGEHLDAYNYRLINPNDWAWNTWWHGREIPDEYHQARQRTLEAISWARQHVSFE